MGIPQGVTLVGVALNGSGNSGRAERRRSKRHDMRAPVWLEAEGQRAVKAVIYNMTEEGFEVEVPTDCCIPLYHVWLIQVGGFFSTQCLAIWSSRPRVGMLMSSPVHAAVISSLAKRYPAPDCGADLLDLHKA